MRNGRTLTTFADFLETHDIYFYCGRPNGCGYYAKWEPDKHGNIMPPSMEISFVTGRLTCPECGYRPAKISFSSRGYEAPWLHLKAREKKTQKDTKSHGDTS